jgi:vacuolar protein sorting-associated protein 11
MLDNLPEETTQLLIDLCTSSGPLTVESEEPVSATTRQPSGGGGASYFSYLVNRPAVTIPDTPTPPSPSIKTVRPDSSSRRNSVQDTSRPSTPPPSALPPSRLNVPLPPPQVKRLSPRIYFAHFVDHLAQFVVFLETVAFRRWGQTVDDKVVVPLSGLPTSEDALDQQADKFDQIAVWNTLLELYLTLPSTKQGKSTLEEASLRDKALWLLKSDAIPYDTTHALILCSSHGYTEGLVLLWEKMGMHEDVLRFWMDKDKEGTNPGASAQVVSHLKRYGSNRPHLYPLVLRFLTSTSELLARHQEDVKDVVQHIDEEKILPPLGVIQILSRNGVASVGLIKEWLVRRIKESRSVIQSVSYYFIFQGSYAKLSWLQDQELVNSYQLETAAKLKQVEALQDPERPHVFHVTRCSSCSGQLDLPSVHFMCDHSYHQRCAFFTLSIVYLFHRTVF